MSDYADDLVRQWEMDDPRDSWRHTGARPPSERVRNSGLSEPVREPVKSDVNTEELQRDLERMVVCDMCGAQAAYGFDVTVDGVRMGDVGSWRCQEHHPSVAARYTREEWAAARAEGKLYPIDQPAVEAAE